MLKIWTDHEVYFRFRIKINFFFILKCLHMKLFFIIYIGILLLYYASMKRFVILASIVKKLRP